MAREITIDITYSFTLGELSERAGVSPEFILELVDLGVLEPSVKPTKSKPMQFEARSLTRLQCARRLHRDLDVNLPGVAMCLDLLEEVKQLRSEVETLHQLMGFNQDKPSS
ncbi:chaperone modulator CbpM [Hahella ganghwensis]|uniref:chaperone modulator CbpM n=1 Tax=Hahella ganghwensis TaxID=286420 RepID=UPI000363AC9D|nr:chaperone modulator CbpM [Hahella ganghwensis]